MRNIYKKLIFIMICFPIVLSAQVNVTIPDIFGVPGDTVVISINSSDVTGLGIVSSDITLTFDGSILNALEASTGDIVPDGWLIQSNPSNGQIIISMAGANPLNGIGSLVTIPFIVNTDALPGDTTSIHFTNMQFNEGNVPAFTHDGLLTVIDSAVQVQIPDTSAAIDEILDIPINVSDVTGLGIISADITLTFNGNILTAQNASIGVVPDGWFIHSNIANGQIVISMAGANPLNGLGSLVIIPFIVNSTAPNGDTTMIHIANLQLNEGGVPISLYDGLFVVELDPPFLIFPSEDLLTNNNILTFDWTEANGADFYHLQVATDSSFSSLVIDDSTLTSSNYSTSTPLGDGKYFWHTRAGNEFIWSEWNTFWMFRVDTTLPASEIIDPLDSETIGGLSYTITGISSDGTGVGVSGVDYVEIRFYHNGSWTGWLSVINIGTNYNTWSYEWSDYESGSYTLESKATDKAGNIEIPQLQTTIYVNLDPPVVDNIIIIPTPTSIGQITCTVIFNVNDFGLNFYIHPDVWFTTLNGDSISFVVTSYSETTWTGVANITSQTENGLATLHVTGATDNLNNVMIPNHNAGNFVIDTQAPTVSTINVTPEITNVRSNLQVEIIFEEEISGLNPNVFPNVSIIPFNRRTKEWITVDQTGYNTQTNTWSGIAEITEQTNEGEADVFVSLAEDQAGNVMADTTITNQLVIDHSPPEEFDLIYPSDSLWIAERLPEIIWSSSSDVFSGLSYYQLFINDNQVGGNISQDDTSKVIETPLPDAGYRARISALDNADEPNIRWSGSDSVHFNVDGTPSVSEITFPPTGYVVQGDSLTVQGTANDGFGVYSGIGVHFVLLSSDGGASWDTVFVATEQFLGQINWEHTYILTHGPHTLVTKSIDWLDNEEIDGSSVTITVESIPAPPANVYINIIENDAVISWSIVDTTIYGNPINIVGYIIYSSSSPDSEFVYLASTTDTTYTDLTVYESAKMFYKVTAYAGDFPTFREIIEEHPYIKLGELDRLVNRKNMLLNRRQGW